MTIIEALKGTNSTRRIDRQALSRVTGIRDRQLREEIHELRKSGHRIIGDTSPQGGYFLGTAQEWDAFCEQQRRRAINNFYRKSNEMPGQMQFV